MSVFLLSRCVGAATGGAASTGRRLYVSLIALGVYLYLLQERDMRTFMTAGAQRSFFYPVCYLKNSRLLCAVTQLTFKAALSYKPVTFKSL